MANRKVENDLRELAKLCGNKERFAAVADFIVNRILLVEKKNARHLRSFTELNHYMTKLLDASGMMHETVSREVALQTLTTGCNQPSLLQALLGQDGVMIEEDKKSHDKTPSPTKE